MTTALRNRVVRRLAALYSLNALLEWVGSIALMVIAYDATGSPLVAAGVLFCTQVVPAVLVPAVAERAEGIGPSAALACAALAQSAAWFALAALGYGAWLFLLVIVAGAAHTLFRSVLRATLARSVAADELRAANALLNMIMTVAVPVAPLASAGLIATVGAPGALVTSGVAFALVALAAVFVPTAVHAVEEAQTENAAEERRPVAGGVKLPLAWMLVLGALTTGVSSIDESSLLVFCRDILDGGVTGYGALFAAQAIGATVGSIAFSRLLGWPMLRVYAMATAIAAIGFAGMAAAPNVWVACSAGVLVGIGAGMDAVAIVTAVQEMAPRGRETQAVARIESAFMVGPAFGLLIGGAIAEFGSVRLAIAVPAVLSVLILVIGAGALRMRASRVRVPEPLVFTPPITTGGSV